MNVISAVSAIDIPKVQSIELSKEFNTLHSLGTGAVTEFAGLPGIGKTQICMQLCVNVQIPCAFGGLEGEAIYVDTEGSFVVQRLIEMALAAINANGLTMSLSDFLARIHIFRVHSHHEQLALLNQLDVFLKDHPKVKLIVIDSIAFHFRQNMTDMAMRTRLLNSMAQMLRKYAYTYNLVIALTNQMTTKLVKTMVDDALVESSILVPALGESWGHACTNRIILFWQDGIRKAWLAKSPTQAEKVIAYSVISTGINDLESEKDYCRKRPLIDC